MCSDQHGDKMNSTDYKNIVIRRITETAKSRREDAGYNGEYGDGGSSQMLENLEYWLDGIKFAESGTSTKYDHIIHKYKLEQDSEYKLYQELKKKFGE